MFTHSAWCVPDVCLTQARKALADRQKDLEVKTQQLEIKLSNKTEEDIKKARRKSTQAGQRSNWLQGPSAETKLKNWNLKHIGYYYSFKGKEDSRKKFHMFS